MKKTWTRIIIGLVVIALGWVFVSRLAGSIANPIISSKEATEKISALFQAPNDKEIDAVIQEWQKRDITPIDWKVEKTGTVEELPIWVVSHRVNGKRHYGLIRFPETPQAGKKYPVLIYNHAGNDGVSLKTLALLDKQFFPKGCLKDNFIYVVPSYSGESLDAGDLGIYKSEGEISVLDVDVDDVLALLNGVIKNIPEADPERMVTLGISRGGGVSLLAAVRDERIKAVAELSGMTDLFLPSIKDEAIDLYTTRRFSANPVMGVVMATVNPYLKGRLSLTDARMALLHSSAVHFVARLPLLEIHHGVLDQLIPIEHSDSLDKALDASDRADDADNYVRHEKGEHDILSMPGSGESIEKFLCPWAEGKKP